MHEPADVAAAYASLTAKHGERFLLGIGVSHAPLIDSKEPGLYRKPLAATRAYLDAIDATEQPVPVAQPGARGAGPENARTRPRHGPAAPTRIWSRPTTPATPVSTSATARSCFPSRPCCSPRTGPRHAQLGTDWLRAYLALPNYANNLLRSGFTQEDIDSVSDRLFDAIIAWGDEETVLRRVNEHLAAGADHVCVQVLTADPREFPREQWRRLAAALP